MKAINKDIETTAGYIFPFEGGKHAATIISLPYRADTWQDAGSVALLTFKEIIFNIIKYERVVLIIDPKISYDIVKQFTHPQITILREYYNDSWARDNTPIFLKNDSEVIGVDFGFNAWGGEYNGLYQDYSDDNALSKNILLDLRIPRFAKKDFILEGGSIHTDGEGTLITTSECLLSKGRNPHLNQSEIEEILKKTLNVQKIIFLPYGIYDDETSGHVDNIACFLKPGVIAIATCENKDDPQYERSKRDLEVLQHETDAKGRKFQIVEMPLPEIQYMSEQESAALKPNDKAIARIPNRRLAASYINFYMSEKFILLPAFNDKNDKINKQILDDFYHGEKEIIQIPSRSILLAGGNIHCITKQIPFSEEIEIEPKEIK